MWFQEFYSFVPRNRWNAHFPQCSPSRLIANRFARLVCQADLLWGWWWVWSREHLVPVSCPLPSWVLCCGLSQNVFAQDMKSHFKMRENRRGGGGGVARQRGHKPHSPVGPERTVSSHPFASIIEHFLFTHPLQPVFKDTLCALAGIEWAWSRWRNWAN